MSKATDLIARVKTADKHECSAIFKELIGMGPGAHGVEMDARAMLDDDEPRRALGARALLAALADEDAELHLRHLLERVASGKGDERACARVYLRDLDGTVVTPALLRALTTHKRASVRAVAAGMAGGAVDVRAAFPVDALIDALADTDQKVREAVMMAIVQHVAPSAGKPSATMTPARTAKLKPTLADANKTVANLARRIFKDQG